MSDMRKELLTLLEHQVVGTSALIIGMQGTLFEPEKLSTMQKVDKVNALVDLADNLKDVVLLTHIVRKLPQWQLLTAQMAAEQDPATIQVNKMVQGYRNVLAQMKKELSN